MANPKSEFVCRRDGLTVHIWGPRGSWKHCASGTTDRSCGKPPIVVERVQYEKEMSEFVAAARVAVGRDR
jgi:hypothetical protein